MEKLVFDSTSEIAMHGGFVGRFMEDYDDRASFLAQGPIDEILVKIKMKPTLWKFKKLRSPNELKFCLRREKPIWFNDRFVNI